MPDPKREIALFPVNAVLFPGARVPLRIFEERYKRLLEDVQRDHEPLGIVLIKEGPETGGTAVPYDVGTLAEIESVEPAGDSVFVLCRGTQRFRIEKRMEDRPYPRAAVQMLPDLQGPFDANHENVRALFALFDQYLENLAAFARAFGGELRMSKASEAQAPIDRAMAVATALPLDVSVKQALLESVDAKAFVNLLLAHLKGEASFMAPES